MTLSIGAFACHQIGAVTMTSHRPRAPRLADFAITGNRMLLALLKTIWAMNYKQMGKDTKRDNVGSTLATMLVSFCASIATRAGRSLSPGGIATSLGMPPSTVGRCIETLEENDLITLRKGRKRGVHIEKLVISNLDHLDSMMTLDHVDWAITIILECLLNLIRLRELLHDQLVANGKDKAAE